MNTCKSCGELVSDDVSSGPMSHWTGGRDDDGFGHRGYCCDCFDLRMGRSLDRINDERVRLGKLPIRMRVT